MKTNTFEWEEEIWILKKIEETSEKDVTKNDGAGKMKKDYDRKHERVICWC